MTLSTYLKILHTLIATQKTKPISYPKEWSDKCQSLQANNVSIYDIDLFVKEEWKVYINCAIFLFRLRYYKSLYITFILLSRILCYNEVFLHSQDEFINCSKIFSNKKFGITKKNKLNYRKKILCNFF